MSKVQGKPVSASSIEGHVHEIFPNDLNPNDTVFGGRIMEIADMLGSVCAKLHTDRTCATLLVDSMRFLSPAKRGEILKFYVSVNRAWNTSLEIGIKVVAAGANHNIPRKVLSAFFTFVALDDFNNPTPIAPIVPETEEEKRRYHEADVRRQDRMKQADLKKEALRAKKEKNES